MENIPTPSDFRGEDTPKDGANAAGDRPYTTNDAQVLASCPLTEQVSDNDVDKSEQAAAACSLDGTARQKLMNVDGKGSDQ